MQDSTFIQTCIYPKVPKSQKIKIENDYLTIEKEFKLYISKFKKAAQKSRITKEPLFRVSSLVNFTDIINVS